MARCHLLSLACDSLRSLCPSVLVNKCRIAEDRSSRSDSGPAHYSSFLVPPAKPVQAPQQRPKAKVRNNNKAEGLKGKRRFIVSSCR